MASKRAVRRSACDDKQRHATKLEALAHATALRYQKAEVGLGVYRCAWCHSWHVGHAPKPPRGMAA